LPDLGQPAFSADKHVGHCRDQAEVIPRLIDATAHRQFRAFTIGGMSGRFAAVTSHPFHRYFDHE